MKSRSLLVGLNIVFTHHLTRVVLLTKPHHSPITTGIYDVELLTPLGTHPSNTTWHEACYAHE